MNRLLKHVTEGKIEERKEGRKEKRKEERDGKNRKTT
jgi:hypothetical protein